MIKLTEQREITPYNWVHPDEERFPTPAARCDLFAKKLSSSFVELLAVAANLPHQVASLLY